MTIEPRFKKKTISETTIDSSEDFARIFTEFLDRPKVFKHLLTTELYKKFQPSDLFQEVLNNPAELEKFCEKVSSSIYDYLSIDDNKNNLIGRFERVYAGSASPSQSQISDYFSRGNRKFIGRIIRDIKQTNNYHLNDRRIADIAGLVGQSFLEVLEKMFVLLDETKKEKRRMSRFSEKGYQNIRDLTLQIQDITSFLDSRERAILAMKLQKFSDSEVLEFAINYVKQVSELEIQNLDCKSREKSKISKEIKKSLLRLLDPEQGLNSKMQENYTKLLNFWNKVLGSPELKFHFLNNLEVVSEKILSSLETGQELQVFLPTCPDYTGFYDENGVWNFDFKGLGTGEEGLMDVGVVGQKAIPMATEVRQTLEGLKIPAKLTHFLPEWEFPENGFQGLSKDETSQNLVNQLEAVRQNYQAAGVDIDTILSSEIILDQDFWQAREEVSDKIKDLISDPNPSDEILKLLNYIFKKGEKLYTRWFPREIHEEESVYIERIKKEVVVKTLAEYIVVARQYLKFGNAIGLDSSSSVMATVYRKEFQDLIWDGQAGAPVIFAYAAKSKHYAGD